LLNLGQQIGSELVQRRNENATSIVARFARRVASCEEFEAMKAITKLLAGGVAIAALASAAPAAAQIYPGYGSPYGYGAGGVIGSIINGVMGGGMGYGMPYGGAYGNPYGGGYGPSGYGMVNSQAAVNQCANAVQARLSGGYGGYGYSQYGGAAPGARVLGISRVEPRGDGGLTVRGVATTGQYGAGYNGQGQVDMTWRCRTDFRGMVMDTNVSLAQHAYGYGQGYAAPNYTPNNPYSAYGYSRY
jgi:hypothetical protein